MLIHYNLEYEDATRNLIFNKTEDSKYHFKIHFGQNLYYMDILSFTMKMTGKGEKNYQFATW